MSHEIRTPLNTTLLGLNLIGKEIIEKHAQLADTAYISEMVSDATNSCIIAIDILNDLLLYEKIDGGLLTLKREELPMWPFLQEVLRVFLIQVNRYSIS